MEPRTPSIWKAAARRFAQSIPPTSRNSMFWNWPSCCAEPLPIRGPVVCAPTEICGPKEMALLPAVRSHLPETIPKQTARIRSNELHDLQPGKRYPGSWKPMLLRSSRKCTELRLAVDAVAGRAADGHVGFGQLRHKQLLQRRRQ